MNSNISKYYIYLLSICFLSPLYAHNGDNPVPNKVSLAVSVNKEVENDVFKAVLSVSKETEDSNLSSSYEQVNQSVEKAFKITKKYKSIEVETRSNSTQPVYVRGKIEGWRINYSIELTSKKRTKLADLVGELQSFMKLDNMQFLVSDELRKRTEDQLITKAILEFNQRADIITRAQKKKLFTLLQMNINNSHQPVQRYSAAPEQAYMSVKSVRPPPIKTGKQKITVSITGTIQLKE